MSSRVNPKSNQNSNQLSDGNFDIQEELTRLEDMILDSPRIPLSGKTLIDEAVLLDQLDLIRINLPPAFTKALEIVKQRHDILQEAQDISSNMIESARQRAAEILDGTGIVQQAEIQAQQILFQAKQECEERLRQTTAEAENIRRNTEQELQQYQQQIMAECQEREAGADSYAANVLEQIERHLTNLADHFGQHLKVIRNGREQLYNGSQQQAHSNTQE